jgi:poly-gamma-glutamate capsule biosynthesis protein CapA/YwtB (metallophosphatase superfamily)
VAGILRLTVLGQASIAHDLRAEPWRGFRESRTALARSDLGFADLETAIRTGLAEAPTREGKAAFRRSRAGRRARIRAFGGDRLRRDRALAGGDPAG